MDWAHSLPTAVGSRQRYTLLPTISTASAVFCSMEIPCNTLSMITPRSTVNIRPCVSKCSSSEALVPDTPGEAAPCQNLVLQTLHLLTSMHSEPSEHPPASWEATMKAWQQPGALAGSTERTFACQFMASGCGPIAVEIEVLGCHG